MVGSTYLHNTFIGTATALLLSGCITNGTNTASMAAKPILNPTAIAFETKAIPEPRGVATAETDDLSHPQRARPRDASQRLSLLQATLPPTMPTKASAFAALANGRLIAEEIKALFSGLNVTTGTGLPETHVFGNNGTVEGSTSADSGIRPANGTAHEDSATWSVSPKNQICMDWFDWYFGDRTCFDVVKRGARLVLSSDRHTIHYAILN